METDQNIKQNKFNSFATETHPTNLKVLEYVHGKADTAEFKRMISKKTKSYFRRSNQTDAAIKCRRGIFQVTGSKEDAKTLLENVVGIEFISFTFNHARVKFQIR